MLRALFGTIVLSRSWLPVTTQASFISPLAAPAVISPPCAGCSDLRVFGSGEDALGAMVGSVNGVFQIQGDSGGRRSYFKDNGSAAMGGLSSGAWVRWDADFQRWLLFDEGYKNGSMREPLYYSDVDSGIPPARSWQAWRGAPPAPTMQTGVIADTEVESAVGCQGVAVMYMSGFAWTAETEQPCLALWVQAFELSAAAHLCIAAVCVAAGGTAIERIASVRHLESARVTPSGRSGCVKSLALYVAGRSSGYLGMLVVMTFSAELFLALLFGLVVGHRVFNFDAPIGEDLTPCCHCHLQTRSAPTAVPPGEGLADIPSAIPQDALPGAFISGVAADTYASI